MAAQRLITILPEMTQEESMKTTTIYSVTGILEKYEPLITNPPFREVHHTITKAALVGGGLYPVPGEISLVNGGVLFLDELSEFRKEVLEALREPLERKEVRINRRRGIYLFTAKVILAAAINPCPCGNYPDIEKCTCTPGEIHRYLGKISRPFLDRIDICIEAPKVTYRELNVSKKEETSAEIRSRVVLAREVQKERFKGTKISTNSEMEKMDLEKYCILGTREKRMLELAFDKLDLTARSYHKILRVARTVADLEGADRIKMEHVAEALSYRTVNQKMWGNQKR